MICPNCFKEVSSATCPYCGYTYDYANHSPEIIAPGVQLNWQYTIGRCLGRGGFGITYSAFDSINGEKCTIKEYFPGDIASRTDNNHVTVDESGCVDIYKSGQESFIEEARSLSKLRGHKNIVEYKSFFTANNTAYLVEEFLDGVNLKKFIAMHYPEQKMDFKNAYLILHTIATTLIDIHKANILHRDITPENIFIQNDGTITLIDFGAAKNYIQNNAGGGSVYIKPGYAPPEQYSADGNQGPWSDIYSLAATFYCILTGISIRPARERLESDNTVPLHQLNKEVSRELSSVIQKALELDPSRRQKNAEEFINELEQAVKKPEAKKGIPCIKILSGPKAGVNTKNGTQYTNTIYMRPGVSYTIGRIPLKNTISIEGNNNLSRMPHCVIKYDDKENCFEIVDESSSGTFEYSKARIVKGKAYKYVPGTKIYLGDRFQTLIELTMDNGGK